jgi:hypothetical protein
MDAISAQVVTGTAPNCYIQAQSAQGTVTIAGPFTTLKEAQKFIATPF